MRLRDGAVLKGNDAIGGRAPRRRRGAAAISSVPWREIIRKKLPPINTPDVRTLKGSKLIRV